MLRDKSKPKKRVPKKAGKKKGGRHGGSMLERALYAWHQFYRAGKEQKWVAKKLGVHRNTVSRYIDLIDEQFKQAGVGESPDDWMARCITHARDSVEQHVNPSNAHDKDFAGHNLAASKLVLITSGDLEDKQKHEHNFRDKSTDELISTFDQLARRAKRLEGGDDGDNG